MRHNRPHPATLEEVRISREFEIAIIEFVDGTIATTHLKIGPDLGDMTDEEILDCFNATMLAQIQLAAAYNHIAVEVPSGSPQIRYVAESGQWVPRGSVLRCLIEDDEFGDSVVCIDDQELSLHDFGRLLRTYAGWGMRIEFVPDNKTEKRPDLEVREPEDSQRDW
ncbi:MAG: hypothetical protein R3C05_12375 [Pirellulaceae bacterium]